RSRSATRPRAARASSRVSAIWPEPTSAGRQGQAVGGRRRGYTRRVTDAGRFERGERYASAHGVVTSRGVDTLTGLDVLVYEFPGAPTLKAGDSVSLHSLKVLGAQVVDEGDGLKGLLVAAYPTGASLLAPGESAVDDRFVLHALEGLRDAHAKGVAHGDITSSRLLYGLGEVYIEGFGVPWRPGADQRALLRADVVAM